MILRHFGRGFLIGLAQALCLGAAIVSAAIALHVISRGELFRGVIDTVLAIFYGTLIFRLQVARK